MDSHTLQAAARIDDATRENMLYFQKAKSEAINSYKRDEAYINTHSGNNIKYSRSDRGGEFMSKELKAHQDQKGTVRELTVHDSPPQNGVSERGMRTRAERARALLLASGLPRFLWAEAMKHVTWIQNRSASRALKNKTPYEMKFKKKPNLAGIQEFGAAAYVKDLTAGKLDARAQVGRFVGYDSESKGFRIYWPNKRSVSVERNVVFNEDDVLTENDNVIIPGDALAEGEKDKVIQSSDSETVNHEPEENSPEPENSIPFPITEPEDQPNLPEIVEDLPDVEPPTGRGARARHPPGTYAKINKQGLHANIAEYDPEEDEIKIEPWNSDDDDDNNDSWYELPPDFALASAMGTEPRTFDEALRGPNAAQWQAAYDYELSQLEKLGTWEVVYLPEGETAIPFTEVLKVKRGPDDEIDSYRLRIVAGGHKQVHGVNYDETFAAAAKMPSVRVVLGNAAQQDWEIHQVDVKSAYLNAPLKETVYMKPPRGVLKPGQEGMVYCLLKGLYGLKQAGRGWHKKLTSVFVSKLGFARSAVDHSVFYCRTETEHTIVAVATDDMAVTSKHTSDVVKFKSELRKHFEITDMGEMKWFLGFEVKRDRAARTISINQRAYIQNMVDKFRLTNAKAVATPMESGAQFSKEQGPSTLRQTARMRGVPYAEAIGSALWPVVISRPDAALAIGILSQFIQNPGQAHWEALKRVIVYLGCTKDLWLTFGGHGKTVVEGFCDADWAGQTHRHSISGYSFHMGVGAVTWSSKKQYIIALSSTEAEYIAQTHAAKELLWLRTFIGEINEKFGNPITLNCDNQGAIALAKDNKFHARTKHIDIRYHFIRESVECGKININYIPTEDNVADIFTKPLAKAKFRQFVVMLGLRAT